MSYAAQPQAASLAGSRDLLERIAGAAFPASWPDRDVLLIGTGRRLASEAEQVELGELARQLPFALG